MAENKTRSKACLSVGKLADLDAKMLATLIVRSVAAMRAKYNAA